MSSDVNILSAASGGAEPLQEDELQGLKNRYASGWCRCVEKAASITAQQLISYLKSELGLKLLKHEGEDVVTRGSQRVGTGIQHWIFAIPDGLIRPRVKDANGNIIGGEPINLCVSEFRHTPRATAQNVMDVITRVAAYQECSPCEVAEKIMNPLQLTRKGFVEAFDHLSGTGSKGGDE